MRSIRYAPYPRECDELMDVLTKDYEFIAEDYPTAWKFRQFLKNLQLCDFSEIYDEPYYKSGSPYNPVIMCNRIIFFSCREKDMERLTYILNRIGGVATIYDGDGGLLYGNYV